MIGEPSRNDLLEMSRHASSGDDSLVPLNQSRFSIVAWVAQPVVSSDSNPEIEQVGNISFLFHAFSHNICKPIVSFRLSELESLIVSFLYSALSSSPLFLKCAFLFSTLSTSHFACEVFLSSSVSDFLVRALPL